MRSMSPSHGGEKRDITSELRLEGEQQRLRVVVLSTVDLPISVLEAFLPGTYTFERGLYILTKRAMLDLS
jgi:hypothetical protein